MIFAGFGADSTVTAAAAAAAPSVTPAATVPSSVAPAAAVGPTVPAPVVPTATITPPVAPTQATRVPFQRPPGGRRGFVPGSLRTRFVSEFDPFPMIMSAVGPRLPMGIRNPRRSEPGAETPRADPSGQSSLPASVPSPVKVNARMLPPGLVMALGIMPPVQGVRSSRVDPSGLVTGGRGPFQP